MNVTLQLKDQVVEALLARRDNYTGTDVQFSTIYGIDKTVFSSLKAGKRDGLLKEGKWLNLARQLDIQPNNGFKLKFVRTEVFNMIEEDVLFCKQHSKSMMFTDKCEIGKTVALRHLSKMLENCFYVDCSQCKGAIAFTRALGQAIGVGSEGKVADLKADIKYALRYMNNPVVLLDEVGDLKHEAFLDLKEYWNGTEGSCGWYIAGADALREKMETGRTNKKVGFAELYSRWSSNYSKIVPEDAAEKLAFYRKLVADVLAVNLPDQSRWDEIVLRCLIKDKHGNIAALRRLESILILEGC